MKDELPKRKPMRLKEFDYSTPGAYFITVCTHEKRKTLSRIVGAIHESPENELSAQGEIVDAVINSIPPHIGVVIDRYVIMPNHLHLIITVVQPEALRAIRESPLQGRSVISKAVGYIKMNASKEIHRKCGAMTVWQRGFHDHVIRDQRDYEKIEKYIHENPAKWREDCFYCED